MVGIDGEKKTTVKFPGCQFWRGLNGTAGCLAKHRRVRFCFGSSYQRRPGAGTAESVALV